MSVFTPSSQVLQRHESLFIAKNLLVAGDFHDDYFLQLNTSATNIHCTSYHIYLYLQSRNKTSHIEFGVQPTAQCYQHSNTLIYYWPKNKAEAQFQLAYLLNNLAKGSDIFIVGENRSGVKSVENILAPFGSIQKLDSARRCSLYHFEAESRLAFTFDEWWLGYQLQFDKIKLDIFNLPGVFSQKSLDTGSELLLDTLIEHTALIKGNVLDIGCGSGVLSALAAKLNPSINLVCADVSAVALASTEKTLQSNNITGKVVASDVFSAIDERFDLIISNPPFHDGKETNYDAVEKLIQQSKNYLKINGRLCIVANSFLPYQRLLAESFKQVEVIAQTTKFKVYLAY